MGYNIQRKLECAVIAMLCTTPRGWARFGDWVSPIEFNEVPAQRAAALIRDITKDRGVSPRGTLLLYQYASELVADKKLTGDDMLEIIDYVEYGIEALTEIGIPSVMSTFERILTRHEKDEAAGALVEAWSKGKKTDRAFARFQKATKVGKTSPTAELGLLDRGARVNEISTTGVRDLLPTGIMELDFASGGGLQRGNVGLIIGGSGDGKSMALSQQAAVSTASGLFVAYASNEVKGHTVAARYEAALYGIDIDAILANPRITDPYYEKCKGQLGSFVPKEWKLDPGEKMCVGDVTEWLKALEDHFGRAVDVLLLDYVDRLRPTAEKHRDKGSYTAGEIIFDELAELSEEKRLWTWTASQTTRSKDENRLWSKNDVADSIHKTRRADNIYTLNLSKSPSGVLMMTISFEKARESEANLVIGPDLFQGRMGRIMPITLFENVLAKRRGKRRR